MPVLQDIYPGASKAIARSAGVLADQLDMPLVSVRDAMGVRMPFHSERVAVAGGPFPDAVVAGVRVMCGSSLQLGTVQLGALAQALRTGANGRWIELSSHLQAFVRDGAIVLLIFLLGFTVIPGALIWEFNSSPPVLLQAVVWSIVSLAVIFLLTPIIKSYILLLQFRHRK